MTWTYSVHAQTSTSTGRLKESRALGKYVLNITSSASNSLRKVLSSFMQYSGLSKRVVHRVARARKILRRLIVVIAL